MGRVTGSGIRALFEDYRRFAGRRFFLALALMSVGALAEGFGLLMIVPLASIAIDRGGRSILASYTAFPKDWSDGRWFTVALLLFVCAMAVRAVVLFSRDLLLSRLQADYEADLRLRATATLAGRGWPFASRIGQDGMQALLLTDVPRAAQATAHLQTFALSAMMLLVQLGLAFVLSPALATVACLFLCAAALLSARVAARGVRSGLAISDSMEESAASGFRLHAGLKASLAQGTVAAFLAEYRTALRRAARQYALFARDYALTRQVAGFGAALVAAILLLVGVQWLALPFPVLIVSLILFARMNAPAQMLQNSLLQAAGYAPAFAAIARRLGPLDASPRGGPSLPATEWRQIAFREVSYRHDSGRGITDVSCELHRGTWLALVGQSGSGKTTFVDLAAGLLKPQSGSILIDGHLLDESTLASWQAGLAYLGQEGLVFNDSVRGNLLAADGTHEASLWEVLEQVGLADRVQAFSSGLDEPLGDRGSQLSGGERQRLILARALLRRPNFLILDEATAAIDAEGEARLMESLRDLEPRPAALVIAHRESTLTHCDSRLSIQHDPVRAGSSFARETTSARINVAGGTSGGKEQ